MTEQPSTPARPALDVAVILRKEPVQGAMRRWQDWRWVLDEVLLHQEGFGAGPRLLYKNDSGERWIHGGLRVELFPDDAEGYQLNATTPAPCWFVLWRQGEAPDGSLDPWAYPVAVSLSYHDASRWLDAQETVEQVPLPAPVLQWLQDFIAAHYQPEPRRPKRPDSFKPLTDRFGKPASVSTGFARRKGEARG